MITIEQFYEMRVLSDIYPNPEAEFETPELKNIAVQMQWLRDDLSALETELEAMYHKSKLTKSNE